MSDLQQRIFAILRQPQPSSLATITREGKPWVRYVITEGNEELTIRFATFSNSRKVSQIRDNPEVHLTCGSTGAAEIKPYLQIQGLAEAFVDPGERHGLWKDSLKSYFQGPDDPNCCVVVIRPYSIELCSPGSLEPELWSVGTTP